MAEHMAYVEEAVRAPVARPYLSASDMCRIQMLTAEANVHLLRANQLAQIEWHVSLLYWGALLTSGVSLIAYAATARPPVALYLAHNDWILLLAYLLASAVFLFGFSLNQARSILETRAQYQLSLNIAHRIAGLTPLARINGETVVRHPDLGTATMLSSPVWKAKMLSTFLYITGIWIAVQILAHGNIVMNQGVAPERIALACAFFSCGDDNRLDWLDAPEWGSILWLLAAALAVLALLHDRKPNPAAPDESPDPAQPCGTPA